MENEREVHVEWITRIERVPFLNDESLRVSLITADGVGLAIKRAGLDEPIARSVAAEPAKRTDR